jgi:arsenite methyltransferase
MQTLFEAAVSDPWSALRVVLDDSLHPGGTAATDDLLDRAGVDAGTRLLDVGCGAGEAVSLARERGARAVGIDRQPGGDRGIRGDMTALPVADGAVDVVLAECVMGLSPDRGRTVSEVRRVLGDDGRLALSDVVVEGDLGEVPPFLAEAFCLDCALAREETVAELERGGFAVRSVHDHHDDVVAMRETIEGRVDYEGLLTSMGERGRDLLADVRELEAAVDDGRIRYASLVADPLD